MVVKELSLMPSSRKFYLMCPLLLNVFYGIWITSRTYHHDYAFTPSIDNIVQLTVIAFILIATICSLACGDKSSKLFRVSAAFLLPLSILFLFFDTSHYVSSFGTILLQIITCVEALLSGILIFAVRGGKPRQKAPTATFVLVVAGLSVLLLIWCRFSVADETDAQAAGGNTSPGGRFTYSIHETSGGTRDAVITISKADAHLNILTGRTESISYELLSRYNAGESLSWQDSHTLLVGSSAFDVDCYK